MKGKSQRAKPRDIVGEMRAELIKNKGDWTRLSGVSDIPYRWIVAFVDGEIKRPSFERISDLGRYIGMRVTIIPCSHFNRFKPE